MLSCAWSFIPLVCLVALASSLQTMARRKRRRSQWDIVRVRCARSLCRVCVVVVAVLASAPSFASIAHAACPLAAFSCSTRGHRAASPLDTHSETTTDSNSLDNTPASTEEGDTRMKRHQRGAETERRKAKGPWQREREREREREEREPRRLIEVRCVCSPPCADPLPHSACASPPPPPPAACARSSREMEKYDLGNLVGKGSFGSVLLVRRRSDGRPFVMKRLPLSGLSGASMESYRTEIQLLSELEHPGIVSYMESFVDRQSMDLCIVMQFCEGGDLAGFIKSRQQQASSGGSGSSGVAAGSNGSSGSGAKLSESAIKSYFIQMCLALHYMHEKNILHRDLKTGNIFLTDGQRRAQLGDFGISKVLGGAQELASTCIGTPYYMSPELFKNKGYNHKSDVWALGRLRERRRSAAQCA